MAWQHPDTYRPYRVAVSDDGLRLATRDMSCDPGRFIERTGRKVACRFTIRPKVPA